MSAEFSKIINSVKMRQFAPFYLVDGEEPFYIDRLTHVFENEILQPHERDFNLITLYGKDVSWSDVVNACRRFPMFSDYQVVILKDAAQLKDFGELLGYLEKPSPTTVFLIEYRFKKADGKTKLVKYAKEKGYYFTSEKLKDDAMPRWIQDFGREVGFQIGEKESQILATYLGNDLQKIANEIEKIRINVPEEKELSAALIQKYIGISREYNVFDFPDAIIRGDKDKVYRMLTYFMANPKSAPLPLVIGSMYGQFSKLYVAHFQRGKSEKEAAAALGTYPSRVKELMAATQQWPLHQVEYILLLMAKYSTISVGIKKTTTDTELLKEMVALIFEPAPVA